MTYRDGDGNKQRYCPDSPFPLNHPKHGEKLQFSTADRPQVEPTWDSFGKGDGDWILGLLAPETRDRLMGGNS